MLKTIVSAAISLLFLWSTATIASGQVLKSGDERQAVLPSGFTETQISGNDYCELRD